MSQKYLFALILVLSSLFGLFAQQLTYTRQDSLRGSITPEREWWDLLHYELEVAIHPSDSTISGTNHIQYIVLSGNQLMQIDLQPPLQIVSVMQEGVKLEVTHEGNAHFVHLKKAQLAGDTLVVTVQYSGKPIVAKNPPWDGGFTWRKDDNGKHFIATSCQGLGASAWWPNKDHPYDEPDNGLKLSINVPKDLTAVGNGRLVDTKSHKDRTKTFIWEVENPINNYGVNVNVGDYVNFKDVYNGERGDLDVSFWVLKDNLTKAKTHFQDAYRTLEAFEYWFGPYPFYEDSYKLVEVPYLGMEHQSSVTYGNGYMKGYKGRDLSLTGWGLKWDYIIVHESGHEWFANNITYKDPADMWIHESFTYYSESLFIEYFYGKQAGFDYVKGSRYSINNRLPIIGDYEVNNEGSDLYNKGANVIHTIRQIINDDILWRAILRGLNEKFYHKVVETKDIEDFIMEKSGLDLAMFFDQYLRDPRVPVLEYFVKGNELHFRWTNCITGFDMPLKIGWNGVKNEIAPKTSWQVMMMEEEFKDLSVDPEYYVYANQIPINFIEE